MGKGSVEAAASAESDSSSSPDSADPAKLLEAALLQMDGIIADAGGGGAGGGGGGGRAARARALDLAQQLAGALQHAAPPPPRPDFTTASAILRWVQHAGSAAGHTALNDAEERVRRLEGDKESLQLQVQVLSEQISAQQDKLLDLERALSDARQRLDIAEDSLQKETLARSSLETQKLELLSKLSEARLRAAERGLLERSPPPPAAAAASVSAHLPHPPPPRTPPANYGRQIERNAHAYSSLPRAAHAPDARAVAFGKQHNNMVVARGRGHSVPNLAEKEEVIPARGSPSPSLRGVGGGGAGGAWARLTRAGSGAGAGGGAWLEGGELTRGGVRATAMPRLQRDHQTYVWQTINVKDWDAETTCAWLESLSLEVYAPAARAWLQAVPDARGVIAAAAPAIIEKELALKHPMHRKKIVLALCDLQGGHGDPHLTAAGRLDAAWVLRWTEDAGLAGARDAAAEAALDGRTLHRLTHTELHQQLRVGTLLHALSVRRGIQVLRENEWSPDTMVRRARERSASEAAAGEGAAAGTGEGAAAGEGAAEAEGEGGEVEAAELARWSSHRVMQWLKEIDLAEYAPNLRGAGVHGGLMLYEPRFTAELLAALLNIPASKTLLRRHLTQRFNDLLGREVIQQKRNAEQTLGYQPLTITSKYKVPKKSQFSLKRRKCRDELDTSELVCPLRDDGSGDANHTPTTNSKVDTDVLAACPPREAPPGR